MDWKKAGIIAGTAVGVFLGVKYILPVMFPFFVGFLLSDRKCFDFNVYVVDFCNSFLGSRVFSRKSRRLYSVYSGLTEGNRGAY